MQRKFVLPLNLDLYPAVPPLHGGALGQNGAMPLVVGGDPLDPYREALGEVDEGVDEGLVRFRQLPPEVEHQVVQEDGHLQLRQLRPGAQPRPAAVRHEAAARRVALQQQQQQQDYNP